MREPVYVDSNIFIFPVIYERVPKAERAEKVLRRIASGGLKAYTSTLTWNEVTWVTYRVLGRADSIEIGKKFLTFPNLAFIDVDLGVVAKAQQLMEKYQISPRDAIHAASAILKDIRHIISEDEDFDTVEELRRLPLKDYE